MARRGEEQGDDVRYHYDDDNEEEDEEEDELERRASRYDKDDDEAEEEHSDYSSAPETSNSMNARERKYAALKQPIASLCSALGGVEQFLNEQGEVYSEYSLGDQVVGCLKDLKRFWRMDERDDDRTVARIFHDVGVLKNDLIPILRLTLGTGAKGDRIALACVELMGAMTWPINVAEELEDAKLKDELRANVDYESLLSAQRDYKAVILRTPGVLRAMFQLMSPSLTKGRRERTTKDDNIISLVLHTFRNLAAIRDRSTTSSSAEATEQTQLQSELVQLLYDEQIFDLLVAIAHNADSSEFAPWNMITLDIFHLIYRSVKPQQLMVLPGKGDENGLKDLLAQEGRVRTGGYSRSGSLGEISANRTGTATRHSRFGTTLAMKANGKKYIMHKQSALSLGPAQVLDKVKKSKAKKIRKDDDLAPPAHMSPAAIQCLRSVALSFVESAFNPFFASVLKDIRMERLKVKESDTVRFLFLSRFFLEFFLLVNADERARDVDPRSEDAHDFDLIAEMTETQAIGFVIDRMRKGFEEKPPLWINVHAGIDCFVQILLVIEALAASGNQDYVDVAEILQNKLYYESTTFEMVVDVLISYKSQSHKYLDSVINLAYVMLRMLEKYSKSKAYMFIRKKTKRLNNRKKGKGADGEDEERGRHDQEDEADRNAIAFVEHAFEFEKYELSFASEAALQTCMKYLEGYKSFTHPDQMKRIVNLLHRQAVKAKSEGLFFKPTVLELFQRMLTDDNLALAHDPATRDLKKLIEYILRKFFKAVQDKPMLLMEIFFPKSKVQLNKLRLGDLDYYASSEDEGPAFKFIKDREVEVEPGFTLSQQIGIATAALTDEGDRNLVDLVLKNLVIASAARADIVQATDGHASTAPAEEPVEDDEDPDSEEALRKKAAALSAGPSEKARELFVPHVVEWPGDEERKAATVNAHFKLLMRLLKWEHAKEPESSDLTWTIPATLLPAQLDADVKLIEDFLLDPVTPQGKSAADLLRKQRKAPVRRKRRYVPDVDEDGNDVEAPARKRAAKRKEEIMAYKSAQFIEDSDDDEEADAAFFAREQALREQMANGTQLARTTSL